MAPSRGRANFQQKIMRDGQHKNSLRTAQAVTIFWYNQHMSLMHTGLLILAVSAVAVADVFLKKTQTLGSMSKAISSPWMLIAVVLYLVQILFFTYLFVSGVKLINVGICFRKFF